MRVLLIVDMEGIAHITHYHELFPAWDVYWDGGRAKLRADVLAAAEGLLAGGASEVLVVDGHGSGAPNLDADDLPARVTLISAGETARVSRERDVDATFQVGRHARTGTSHAFASHTWTPRLALALDGRLITESHLLAAATGVPLLGITGDDALAAQLDGLIAGTPYLVVKHSLSRATARPAHADARQTASIIRAFAAACARQWRSRPVPTLPASFTFAASTDPAWIGAAVGQQGLERGGPGVVRKLAHDWWRDVEPAIGVVALAALTPLLDRVDGVSTLEVDLSTPAAVQCVEPAVLARFQQQLADWIAEDEPAWHA